MNNPKDTNEADAQTTNVGIIEDKDFTQQGNCDEPFQESLQESIEDYLLHSIEARGSFLS